MSSTTPSARRSNHDLRAVTAVVVTLAAILATVHVDTDASLLVCLLAAVPTWAVARRAPRTAALAVR